MSKADMAFITMCQDILANGTSTEGELVRPHWPDGSPAYTTKKFGVVNRYDLSEEFPAVTLRKTYIKSAMGEILWIWQKKSNDVRELGSHIWDEWAGQDHTIGKAYGYQLAKKHRMKGVTEEGLRRAFKDLGEPICVWEKPVAKLELFLSERDIEETEGMWADDMDAYFPRLLHNARAARMTDGDGNETWSLDQVDQCLYQLVNTPFSRRIMATTWDPGDLAEMNLQPCAYSMTFNVTQEKDGKLVLNAILNQRSQDVLAANAWNVAQYALLLMMFARHCGMEAGELVHVIADAHIYDRHVPMVEELVGRSPKPAPKVWLDVDVDDFYRFTAGSLHIEGYEAAGPQIKDIPIAI